VEPDLFTEKPIKEYKWAGKFYFATAVVLIPWIIILADSLPSRHVAHDWNTLWVGFDISEVIVTLITVYFLVKKKIWLVISASILATLFVVDAWFDILTSKSGMSRDQAYFFGIIEVGMSLLTFRLVFHVVQRAIPNHNLMIVDIETGDAINTLTTSKAK
jgi:hypothetical protein